jgi:hypothetical protein
VLLIYFLLASYAWRIHDVFLLGWEDILAFAFAGAAMGWAYDRLPVKVSNGDERLATRSFALGDAGFETWGTGFRTSIDWTAIREIADRGENIFFVTKWGENFFVPKSAFATRAAADAFGRRANALLTARRDKVALEGSLKMSRLDRYVLTYRLERSDLAAFAALRRELTGPQKAILLAPALAIGALYGWYREGNPAFSAFVDDLGNWTIIIFIGLVLVYFAIIGLGRRAIRAYWVRRSPLPPGGSRLIADRNGIEVTTDGKRERFAWRDVPAVTIAEAQVFLFTAPERAIIVPLRAFSGRPAMTEFFHFADEASSNAET